MAEVLSIPTAIPASRAGLLSGTQTIPPEMAMVPMGRGEHGDKGAVQAPEGMRIQPTASMGVRINPGGRG